MLPSRRLKPKRRLNAYNFFFKMERERLLKTLPTPDSNKSRKGHGKIGFKDLARTVSANWKVASQEYKDYCLELAKKDKIRYEQEMREYKAAENTPTCDHIASLMEPVIDDASEWVGIGELTEKLDRECQELLMRSFLS